MVGDNWKVLNDYWLRLHFLLIFFTQIYITVTFCLFLWFTCQFLCILIIFSSITTPSLINIAQYDDSVKCREKKKWKIIGPCMLYVCWLCMSNIMRWAVGLISLLWLSFEFIEQIKHKVTYLFMIFKEITWFLQTFAST